MEKTTKRLDAVRLVRRIRDAHYEALRAASREERIAFYNGGGSPSSEQGGEREDPSADPAPAPDPAP